MAPSHDYTGCDAGAIVARMPCDPQWAGLQSADRRHPGQVQLQQTDAARFFRRETGVAPRDFRRLRGDW